MMAIVVCLLVTAISAVESQAAMAWYNCNVRQLGVDQGYYTVQLAATAPSTFTQWYTLSPTTANAQLAVILTAASTGQQVSAYVDPNNMYAYIYSIYLNNY